jgi:hypothetical protein
MEEHQFQQYNQVPQNPYPEDKKRHGCVTTWLILLMTVNSGAALLHFFFTDLLMQYMPYNVSPGMLYLLGFFSVMNVVFAVLLFQYKKFGFWGFIVSAIAGFLINLQLGLSVGQAITGFVSIGVLFAILQIKQNGISAWEQME